MLSEVESKREDGNQESRHCSVLVHMILEPYSRPWTFSCTVITNALRGSLLTSNQGNLDY